MEFGKLCEEETAQGQNGLIYLGRSVTQTADWADGTAKNNYIATASHLLGLSIDFPLGGHMLKSPINKVQ